MARGRGFVFLIVAAIASVPFLSAEAASAAPSPPLSWSIMAGPNPPVSSNDTTSLSCTSAQFCMSVGPYTGPDPAQASEWNGTSWNAFPALAPTGALSAVSCVSGTFCMAVGSLGEMWNGSTWSQVPIPGAGTPAAGSLQGVSCLSATNCQAVGWGPGGAITERWNGSIWSTVTNPDSANHSLLFGVSCETKKFCVAVGFGVVPGSSQQGTVIEQWDGIVWSLVPSPNVPAANNELVSVSCVGDSFCEAVGVSYESNEVPSLIETWNGSTWAIAPSPDSPAVGVNQYLDVSVLRPTCLCGIWSNVNEHGQSATGVEVGSQGLVGGQRAAARRSKRFGPGLLPPTLGMRCHRKRCHHLISD